MPRSLTPTLLSSVREFVALTGSRVAGSGISEIFTKNIDARKSTTVNIVVVGVVVIVVDVVEIGSAENNLLQSEINQ